MDKTTWILQADILDRMVYHSRSLPWVLEDQGHEVLLIKRPDNGIWTRLDQSVQGPVVVYGAHEFARAINPHGHYQPGNLGLNDSTQAIQYMSNLPLEWFLNRGTSMMSWAMFKDRRYQLFDTMDSKELFIRPNSGFKTFAGQRVKASNIDDHISTLDQTSSVVNDTLILVAPGQHIQGEFRFVIADKRVIAGSEYRWDGRLDVRADWPDDCWDLAQRVADHDWQVDIAYTCDVATTDNGPKVVELNSFSSAGLYACDLEKVVQGVSKAAFREWSGLDLQ
jgi:hypothetical protein